MSFSPDRDNELEQYGTAVGVAIANGLHDEAMDLAFTRGGGITVRENAQGTTLPTRTDLDANAVGGADATLTFAQGAARELSGLQITSYGIAGTVDVQRSGDRVSSIGIDKDNDGKAETSLRFERNNGLTAIHLDEDNDGKVDAILTAANTEGPLRGVNVDLRADGSIDGFAEFIRNENNEIKSIRFRQLQTEGQAEKE
jgi:hypothetical protein